MYTFVNKNFLIPIINIYDNKNEVLTKLHNDTISRTIEYNNNVYIVFKNDDNLEIYWSDGFVVYCKKVNSHDEPYILYKYDNINFMGINYSFEQYDDILISNNMNLTIKNKSNDKIIVNDDNKKKVSFNNPINTLDKFTQLEIPITLETKNNVITTNDILTNPNPNSNPNSISISCKDENDTVD